MAHIIVFHHVQGLTAGVVSFADQLRAAGHTVATPDLFDGALFDSIESGVAYAEAAGFMAIVERGVTAAADAEPGTVVAGFSLGALIAHKLAQTAPRVSGALLYHHGDVAWDMFGDSWPAGVDIQLHVNEADEFCEVPVVRTFADAVARSANAELYLYPGTSHLFLDPSLGGYEPENAELAVERSLAFLARL